MQHSPKAGVFNKLKKKLTKGRRYEIGPAGSDETDSIKLQKFDAMYARLPTQGDGGPKSRDSSPSIMDMESPKRSILDSPQRANLTEKDINKTNTYTKDPTKEQKKNGSPTKEVKMNQKGGDGGPIIFINNTYDLPPILPVKKGAIISDKRQRSKERHHKDQVSNKDGKKSDSDKQTTKNDKGEANKENSSKVGSKSPHKSSKFKGSLVSGGSRADTGAKAVSISSDEPVSSGCNSATSSGDGKIKSKDGQKDYTEHLVKDKIKSVLKSSVKGEESGEASPRGVVCDNLDNRSPKIVNLLNGDGGSGIWGSPPKVNQNHGGSRGFGSSKNGSPSNPVDGYHIVVNSQPDIGSHRDASTSSSATRGKVNHALCDNGLGNRRNLPESQKASVDKLQNESSSGSDKMVQPSLLKYESPNVLGKEKDIDQSLPRNTVKPANQSSTLINAKDHKSVIGILQKEVNRELDKCIITETATKSNQGEDGEKKENTDKNTSHAKFRDVPLFRPLRAGVKIPTEKNEVEDRNSQQSDRKSRDIDEQTAQNCNDDDDSDSDMELGYTSLADVEKIFGSKKNSAASSRSHSSSPAKVTTDGGLLLRQNLFTRDGNGNVMHGQTGCVIKCDVNVQGCDVRPLLVERLASARFQEQQKETTDVAHTPKVIIATDKPDLTEESEYGSIGDYSSKNMSTKAKIHTSNSNMGARPKQKPIGRSATPSKDLAVLKITKEMSKLPGYQCSSSPDIQKNFDLNLNLEVERGISHESGYETGGSGLRSHSSSSNEFIQHDSSSYSLVSEPGEELPTTVNSHLTKNIHPDNLNDSTSSEETAEMRSGPVYRDTIERPEDPTVLASLYAFVPKCSQRGNDASNADPENADSEKSGGSSDKTESQNRSSIQSPDSIKLEDTLIEDYDSESYDEVDYGFEDGDEEDDDYLPPIPTRNYASEEKRLQEIIESIETSGQVNKPPLMTVVGSKTTKEQENDKPSLKVDVKTISPDKEQEPEVLDLSLKSKTETVVNVLEISTVSTSSETVMSKNVVSVNSQNNGESTESRSTSYTAQNKVISDKSCVKSPIKDKSSGKAMDFTSNVDKNQGKSNEVSSIKVTSGTASCSKNENFTDPTVIKATLNTTQNSMQRNSSYSPIRRRSYEKVERSIPQKEGGAQCNPDPRSPPHSRKENRSSSGARLGRHRKDSENCSKEGKDNVCNDKSPDNGGSSATLQEKSISKGSNTSLDSSKTSKEDLRKSILDFKPDKKTGDSPSKTDELYNQSFSSDSTLSLDQPFWASFEEPVHMSMEEVLNQAKDLGIPLSLPNGSPSKDSSTENICSPTHRYSTKTLPCPRHGVITQDKLPRKKPGTLKDKFASLFTRKSGSSTSPKHNDPRCSENIQKRSLPPPPSSNDIDTVDGGTCSPRKRDSHHSSSKSCEIHGTDDMSSRTISPSQRHSSTQQENCCCNCPNESDRHSSSSSTSQGRYNKHSNSGGNGYHHTMPHQSHHRNTNPGVHLECGCCDHSFSPCKNATYQGGRCGQSHCGCQEGSGRHRCSNRGHRTLSAAYPRHRSVSSSRHGNNHQVSPDKKHHHHTGHHYQRERSHSRDDTLRSRSPNTNYLPKQSPSSSSSGRQAYLSSTEPWQTRSSSSSGLFQRCPPSPAPSTGTSSVVSAPSAFSFPPTRSCGPLASPPPGSARRRRSDSSPSRSSCQSHSNPSINLNGNADFIASLSKLKDVGWYWGPLSWDDAEAKLGNKPDGAFLVRDSSDDRYILSLSFRSQGTTHHTRIEHYKGMFSFYSQPKSHGAATIIEFVEKAMDHSRSGKFLYFLRPRAPGLPPAPVQLLFPISRFQTMQTLQHLCRFSILKHVRRDHINQLPVPQRIKDYLEMSQYYIEYLGEDMGFRQ